MTMTSAGKLSRARYFEIAPLPPGLVHLTAFTEPEGAAPRQQGNLSVDLRGNEKGHLVPLRLGVDLAIETLPKRAGIEIHWGVQERFHFQADAFRVETDAEGRAIFPGRFVNDAARLLVRRLPEGWLVQRALYADREVDLDRFLLDPAVTEHRLRLELAEPANRLEGKVTRSGKDAPGAFVVAIREPVDALALDRRARQVEARADGTYSLPTLLPGHWRVAASAGGTAADAAYATLLRGAGKRIEVGTSSVARLDLSID